MFVSQSSVCVDLKLSACVQVLEEFCDNQDATAVIEELSKFLPNVAPADLEVQFRSLGLERNNEPQMLTTLGPGT